MIFMKSWSISIYQVRPEKIQTQTIYLNNMIDERFRSIQQISVIIVIIPSTIDMALNSIGEKGNKINNHNQLLKALLLKYKIFLFPYRSHFIPKNH